MENRPLPQRYSAQRSRAHFGVLLLLITVGVTVLRVRATNEPLEHLTLITRLYAEGKTSDLMLSQAQYHGAHAQRRFDTRWSVSGYATHALIGGALGLALIFVRRRTGAG
jgi:hypothetical protein